MEVNGVQVDHIGTELPKQVLSLASHLPRVDAAPSGTHLLGDAQLASVLYVLRPVLGPDGIEVHGMLHREHGHGVTTRLQTLLKPESVHTVAAARIVETVDQ